MNALYYLKRAMSLPPRVTLQKLICILKNVMRAKKSRWVDKRFSTYEAKYSIKRLNKFLNKIELSLLPKEEILHLSHRYLNHEFDLLGSEWVKVFHGMTCNGIEGVRYTASSPRAVNFMNRAESGLVQRLISKSYTPIDWQIDFKSGYRWKEDTWSQDIRYGSQPGADVKVPWELARMQHLVTLAWGYALEQDGLYALEFRNQILDFISSNPPRYGVNWVCTMDVGIRIANWLIAYDLFQAYGAKFDDAFENIFARSVYEHGKHIFSHLEWDPHLRSNHYLANIAGLLFAAAYLPKDQEIDFWLNFSIRELQGESVLQFHPDGSNFEASTSYHCLSTEMVLYATAVACELGIEFPLEYLDRLQKMADFIRDITTPDGAIVQFGDNDSGRFIKMFPNQDGLDHRYLIDAIREAKGLPSIIQAQLKKNTSVGPSLCSYSDFGLYIQRKDPWFLAIRCGCIGQRGNGGHAHNDQLSFELSVHGISMIIDPGTYVYTPFSEERRRFRSTAMHNTLAIVGKEQNLDEGLFRMSDKAEARVVQFADGLFIGEHRGFGSIHRRTLKILGECLEGIDEFKEGSKKIYFHIAPGWQMQNIAERKTVWTYGNCTVQIFASEGSWILELGEYSRAYGVKENGPVLVLLAQAKKIHWEFRIFP